MTLQHSQRTPGAPGSHPKTDWGWEVAEVEALFPDHDYAHSMRFKSCPPDHFFGPTSCHGPLTSERRRWLQADPAAHAALLPEGEPILDEVLRLSAAESPPPASPAPSPAAPLDHLMELGCRWEPDFLLLKAEGDGPIRLVAGCVCFPSGWSLADKLGRPMSDIHGPVPGLNEHLGQKIEMFLRRMRPGQAWLRANWGLSASPELNLHPQRRLPALDSDVTLETAWLRVEHQALVALPESGGILFGIRIALATLVEVRGDPRAARGLARALSTMPEAMLDYKRLTVSRDALVRLLEN